MDCLDDMTINHYFNLSQKIKDLQRKARLVRWEFYQQSMNTRVTYGDDGMYTAGFRAEHELSKMDEAVACLNAAIDRNAFRYKHFMAYLDQLTTPEQTALKRRYMLKYSTPISDNLMEKTLNEINEIETALCFREGLEVPIERVALSDDLMANIDFLAGVAL